MAKHWEKKSFSQSVLYFSRLKTRIPFQSISKKTYPSIDPNKSKFTCNGPPESPATQTNISIKHKNSINFPNSPWHESDCLQEGKKGKRKSNLMTLIKRLNFIETHPFSWPAQRKISGMNSWRPAFKNIDLHLSLLTMGTETCRGEEKKR